MAVGVAFVDIVGDTSGTSQQLEHDMNHVVAQVQGDLSPVDVSAQIAPGTQSQLVNQLEADLLRISQSAGDVNVQAHLVNDPGRLAESLHRLIEQAQTAGGELHLQVDAQHLAAQTHEAVAIAEELAPPIEIETHIDRDRLLNIEADFSAIGRAASAALPAVGQLGVSVLAVGQAVPLIAAVVATLEQIAPAAALAAPAIVSVGLALGTVKLATIGIKDAVTAALDPSDPDKYAKSLEGLAPNAKAFVEEIHTLQPALKGLQLDVQNRLFDGLAGSLHGLAGQVLPLFQGALTRVAGSLSLMGQGVAGAVRGLAEDGALGQALNEAQNSLGEFTAIPAKLVTAFGQVASAAAPIFHDLSIQAAGALGSALDKLSGAFASGELQAAIKSAVALVGELIHVGANVGKIFSEVLGAADASGTGLIGTLTTVTDALVKAFADPNVQAGLKQLFATMAQVSSVAGPVLVQAIKTIAGAVQALLPTVADLVSRLGPILTPVIVTLGKVIAELAPGLEVLVNALLDGLDPVIHAIQPLLLAVADAIAELAIAVSPLLPVLGELISKLGPILTPIVDAVATLFMDLAPLVEEVAMVLGSTLGPILDQLPGLIQPFLDLLLQLVERAVPVLTTLLLDLEPSLQQLTGSFVELALELAPVLARLGELIVTLLDKLSPIIPPLIDLIVRIAGVLTSEFAKNIENILIPTLQALIDLMNGDGRGAFDNLLTAAKGVATGLLDLFIKLPAQIGDALADLGVKLYHIGNDIMQSLIDGITSKFSGLHDELSFLTNVIPKWKGPMDTDRSLLTANGEAIMDGFIDAIRSRRGPLFNELQDITATIPQPGVGGVTSMGVQPRLTDVSSLQGMPGMSTALPGVQVFIGTKELTDIIGVQLRQSNGIQSRAFLSGSRA